MRGISATGSLRTIGTIVEKPGEDGSTPSLGASPSKASFAPAKTNASPTKGSAVSQLSGQSGMSKKSKTLAAQKMLTNVDYSTLLLIQRHVEERVTLFIEVFDAISSQAKNNRNVMLQF